LADDEVVSSAEQLFGKEIQRARVACGISQEELGHRADIHSSYVSQLERGLKSPSLGVILRVAGALEHPASELIKAVEIAMSQRPTGKKRSS